MAGCASIPSCAHVQLQKFHSKKKLFVTRSLYSRSLQRECCRKEHLVSRVKPSVAHFRSAPHLMPSRESGCLKYYLFKPHCLRTLIDAENAVPYSWVPIANQVLLTISVISAYVAGVIPGDTVFFRARDNKSSQQQDISGSTDDGRQSKSIPEDYWTHTREKLLDGFNAIKCFGDLNNEVTEIEGYRSSCPLNLFVLYEGPRLRLIWSTIQQLENEVNVISQALESDSRNIWIIASAEALKRVIDQVSAHWLEEELKMAGEHKRMLTSGVLEKLKSDDRLSQNIRRSGKVELYADLLCFLRYGSLSEGCCYDEKDMTQNGVDILEDLVVTLADTVASIFLELISIDSDITSEMNILGLRLCSLSTRALQKLRNEVALKQWLQENFESVIMMYEDRFELSILCREQVENPAANPSEKVNWWNKLLFGKPTATSSLCFVRVSTFSLPVKRTKELRALNGWRYYFSLILEFSDITMPLVKAIVTKISKAISFFLVYMIGRSLGLVFNGIRQSLRWR